MREGGGGLGVLEPWQTEGHRNGYARWAVRSAARQPAHNQVQVSTSNRRIMSVLNRVAVLEGVGLLSLAWVLVLTAPLLLGTAAGQVRFRRATKDREVYIKAPGVYE